MLYTLGQMADETGPAPETGLPRDSASIHT